MSINVIRSKRIVLWLMLLVVLFSFPAAAEETKGGEPIFSDVEKDILELMETGNIPGLSVAVVKDGQVYTRGFGYADLEKKTPVTDDTQFELASCSKAFTAVALLQCEEKGLVNLDDPVSRYFPDFYLMHKGEKVQVTLKQLLHHTSGIPVSSLNKIPVGPIDNALEQTVKNFTGLELTNPPGEEFLYATGNYDIIGAVIAKVSGMSYEEYMVQNVFKPLGLNDTFVEGEPDDPKRATGYKIGFFAPRPYQPPLIGPITLPVTSLPMAWTWGNG